MTIPSMNDVLVPCLRLLASGAKNANDCLPGLKADFGLSDEEMNETIPSGQRRRIFDRADWGLFHLMKAGLVERPQRGVYKISQPGKVFLDLGTASLTLTDLKKMPAYVAAMKRVVESEADQGGSARPVITVETNPEDAMQAAHDLLDAALRENLLAHLAEMHPTRFERLILDLLSKMGFGGGDLSRARMTKASGDGGIDGIIHEDVLASTASTSRPSATRPATTSAAPRSSSSWAR